MTDLERHRRLFRAILARALDDAILARALDDLDALEHGKRLTDDVNGMPLTGPQRQVLLEDTRDWFLSPERR